MKKERREILQRKISKIKKLILKKNYMSSLFLKILILNIFFNIYMQDVLA